MRMKATNEHEHSNPVQTLDATPTSDDGDGGERYAIPTPMLLVPPEVAERISSQQAEGKTPSRIILGTSGVYPPSVPANHPESIKIHSEGTEETDAEILLDLAILKQVGIVLPSTIESSSIELSGARYQDCRGSEEIQQAHRATGNLRINGKSLPVVAANLPVQVVHQLTIPIKSTDPLTKAGNYADRLIGINGANRAFARAARFVLEEQQQGKPVKPSLIQHAARQLSAERFQAKDQAYEYVKRKGEDDYARLLVSAPAGLRQVMHVAEGFAKNEASWRTPSKQTETVKQVLERSLRANRPAQVWTNPHVIDAHQQHLTYLALNGSARRKPQ